MLNDHNNPQPTREWTLDMWRTQAGARSADEIVDVAAELGITDKESFEVSSVGRWFRKGMPSREKAVYMIAILSEIASRNKKSLLNGAELREHARIFLNSRACNERYAELDEDELMSVSHDRPASPKPRFHELRSRVFPRPPARQHFYGRDNDLQDVLSALQSSPVSVIDAVGGNGKTSLAWHAALQAVETGIVQAFDWTTDKRTMLSLDGLPLETNLPPLDFNRILRSMAVRFEWYDVMTAQDSQLEGLCADRLRQGLYLIVVDNLETIEQRDVIVDRLSGLLEQRRSRAPLTSRALITSRVQVREPNARRIELGGLGLPATRQYIAYLQRNIGNHGVRALNDREVETLWQVTEGNPLFLQIAVARYMRASATFPDIVDSIASGEGLNQGFQNLFSGVFHELSEPAQWLAIAGADMPSLTFEALRDVWVDEAGGDLETFDHALKDLVQYHVIEPMTPNTPETEEYSMHPLVRAFLKVVDWDDADLE